jgi:hypothetical protein
MTFSIPATSLSPNFSFQASGGKYGVTLAKTSLPRKIAIKLSINIDRESCGGNTYNDRGNPNIKKTHNRQNYISKF